MTKYKCIALAIAAPLFLVCESASAQSIGIISGNGQLACEACARTPILTFDPLVVQVKDTRGNPLPGATITWTTASVVGAQGTFSGTAANTATSTTDGNGMASVNVFVSPLLGSLFAQAYVQASFTATITALPAATSGTTGQSVSFTESDALTDIQTGSGQNGIIEVGLQLIAPTSGSVITGPAGSTQNGAIQAKVTGFIGAGGGAGTGVPGVAVILEPPAGGGPSISCATGPGGQKNIAITDNTGTATCNVVFGGAQGSGVATLAVGQTDNPFGTFNISFTTTQGVPGGIQITTGNNQAANAGQLLPAPLVATVVDQAGNPLSGVNVTWNVTSGSGTLFNQRTTSDLNGKISANLTLGSTPGQVVVTVAIASAPSITAQFTETVNVNITGMSIASGNGQTASVNTAFASPLVVQVTNSGQPVSGVNVTFTVASGSGSVASPGTAQTNAAGQASIGVTAGPTAGTLVITATVLNFTQNFNLTVAPPGPTITAASFYNAASLQSGQISACSLATIIATGLAPGLQNAILPPVVGQLPLQVYNDSVSFANNNPATSGTTPNILAPIWDVANINGQEQMTIEIPCELIPGNVSVTVTASGGKNQVNLALKSAAPGIFQTPGSDRVLRAVVVRQDGSFVAKENPARRGETVYLFVTGLGPVIPQIGTNQIGIPGTISNVQDLSTIVVGVNNGGAQVVSAAYASDLVGVYVIGFIVDPSLPTGDLPLAIAVIQGGQFIFGNPSIIPVQ